MFHIIDDTKLVSEVISESLKKLGYGALEFGSPAEYITYAGHPDFVVPRAVFTGATMAQADGYTMMDTLSGLKPDLTVVVMTARRVTTQNGSANRLHLAKPFRFEDIKNVVDTIISRRGA